MKTRQGAGGRVICKMVGKFRTQYYTYYEIIK
jgi:hypothetical protein